MKLAELQRDFVAMIRSGEHSTLDAVETRRLKIYRDLFFNNIEGLLANGFPVTRKILGRDRWLELVRCFWREHRCQTPYFPRIGSEWVSWLQTTQPAILPDFPFLTELAHYEYMEVSVDLAEEDVPAPSPGEPITLETPLQVNPASVLLAYHYPVHRVSPDFLPTQSPETPTYLMVYRNGQQQVKFMELTPGSAQVIQMLQSGSQTMAVVAAQLHVPVEQMKSLATLIGQLREAEVVFPYKRH